MKFSTAIVTISAAVPAAKADEGGVNCQTFRYAEDHPDCAGGLVARCYVSMEGDSSGSARRLVQNNDGSVVHSAPSGELTGMLPRAEVAAAAASALEGGSDFELQVPDNGKGMTGMLGMLDLTRDGMTMDVTDASELTGAFTLINAFIVDDPGVYYKVVCPAQSSDLQAAHCTYAASDEDGNDLVQCGEEKSLLPTENVPSTCLDELYDVTLKAFEHGPHFFLSATRRGGDTEGRDSCPRNVAFDSKDGTKKRAVMLETDLEQLPGHALGAATLGDLLRAEGEAAPLSDGDYDIVDKNCATYARDILRGAGLPETEELAQFYIRNLEKNPDTLASMRLALGRGRSLALSVLRFGRNEGWLEQVVYSQLEIAD